MSGGKSSFRTQTRPGAASAEPANCIVQVALSRLAVGRRQASPRLGRPRVQPLGPAEDPRRHCFTDRQSYRPIRILRRHRVPRPSAEQQL